MHNAVMCTLSLYVVIGITRHLHIKLKSISNIAQPLNKEALRGCSFLFIIAKKSVIMSEAFWRQYIFILTIAVNSEIFPRILFSRIALKDIFATLKSQIGQNLTTSVNNRVILPIRVGFIFTKLREIKLSRKFPILQYRYSRSSFLDDHLSFLDSQYNVTFKCLHCHPLEDGERSGSIVECLTRDRGAAGSSLTGVTPLCPWAKKK